MIVQQVAFPFPSQSRQANHLVALEADVDDPTLRSWEIKRSAAQVMAMRAADTYGLPQTVYRNADSAGWAHTHPFASFLARSEVFVTVLNSNYFS